MKDKSNKHLYQLAQAKNGVKLLAETVETVSTYEEMINIINVFLKYMNEANEKNKVINKGIIALKKYYENESYKNKRPVPVSPSIRTGIFRLNGERRILKTSRSTSEKRPISPPPPTPHGHMLSANPPVRVSVPGSPVPLPGAKPMLRRSCSCLSARNSPIRPVTMASSRISMGFRR